MPNASESAIRAARRSAAIRLDGLARPRAGDVECRAVIGRCADERQSQRDVDRPVESQRLDRDQRLIVIHADRAVVGPARGFMEHGVGGKRASDVDALGAQRCDGRSDDCLILGSERAVLAGMGI